jgi:hypothetical protein
MTKEGFARTALEAALNAPNPRYLFDHRRLPAVLCRDGQSLLKVRYQGFSLVATPRV